MYHPVLLPTRVCTLMQCIDTYTYKAVLYTTHGCMCNYLQVLTRQVKRSSSGTGSGCRQGDDLLHCFICEGTRHKRVFGERPESKPAIFLFAEGDVEACRSKAHCGSQRHSRPNRIISAVEWSIRAGVGVGLQRKEQCGEEAGEEEVQSKAKTRPGVIKWRCNCTQENTQFNMNR